ncbi:MAG: hypothetical protein EZS28_037652 [Streblomastix strix]|uniref:Uncharacterized protein n=1 Tax=Streblomastix strix TaxID=222440 RepID=A0A5J4UA86_9EUKA|nr:MAG: hypothetical protein EZS28_037652 [Streblomastix strix]
MKQSEKEINAIPIKLAPPCLVAPPLIVSVPDGVENGDVPLTFDVFGNLSKQSRRRKIIGHSDTIQLQGSNFDQDTVPPYVARYGVLEYSKSKQTLQLRYIPHLYLLSQEVQQQNRRQLQVDEAPDRNQNEADALDDWLKIDTELTEQFGSKIRKASRQRMELYSINNKKIDSTAIDKELTQGATNPNMELKIQNIQKTQPTSIILPFFNPQANSPEDVYPLSSLIPEEIRPELWTEQLIHFANLRELELITRLQSEQWCSFVINRLDRLKLITRRIAKSKLKKEGQGQKRRRLNDEEEEEDSNNDQKDIYINTDENSSEDDEQEMLHNHQVRERQKQALILVMINHGWLFYRLGVESNKPNDQRGNNAQFLDDINNVQNYIETDSPAVASFFINTFTSEEFSQITQKHKRNRMPQSLQTKLIMWILLLTLHADGFMSDISDIAQDLSMQQSKLIPYVRELGIRRVQSDIDAEKDDKIVIHLKLPLVFPFQGNRARPKR